MKRLRVLDGRFGDAHPSGRYAALVWDNKIVTDSAEIYLPGIENENVLFLRASLQHDIWWLAGQGHQTDRAWLWNGKDWTPFGGTMGVNPAAFDRNAVLFCKGGNVCQIVFLETGLTERFDLKSGSQGIRWVRPDGKIITCDSTLADPSRGLWQYTDYGDVTFGEGADEAGGGCLVRFLGEPDNRLIEAGRVRYVRVQREGDQFAIAFSRHDTGEVVFVWATKDELHALPYVNQPHPPEPPVTTPNHLPTVVDERDKYPKDAPLGIENAWAICNAVAWRHKDEGFGLRKKLTGNNYNGSATDIVYHLPSNMLVDILRDSDVAGIAAWSEVGPGDPNDWMPPSEPEDDVDPPIPPPDDTLESRVEYLEAMVAHIRECLHAS